ncbi:hypothetical protein ACROYT_G035326 [Oculina patagonica]
MEENSHVVDKSSSEPSRRESEGCYLSCRYALAILSCSGFCVLYLSRVNLSVALVAMVNSTYADAKASANNPECQRHTAKTSKVKDGEFNWDQDTQGLILGSFFYGYIVTQVPAGWLAARFGGKYLFGCGVLLTSVMTMFTPAAAHHSVGMLILVRVVEGLGQGVAFPAMHAMWSSWAPPLERSKLCTLSYSGLTIGTILGMPFAGLLCASDIWGGWPSVFYIFGAVGIVWTVVWMMLTYDKPANHPRISIKEKEYIQSSIGSGQDVITRKYNTPWLKIWTSPPVWAIIAANFCDNWGFYTFLTCLPSYFKEVLNFSISENGIVSAIPFIVSYIVGIGGGQLADWLRYNNILTTGEVRKVSGTAGYLVPACLLVSTSYVGCNQTSLAVVLFSLAIGIQALNTSCYSVNHLDIAPRFAGILMGISNSVGTIPGIIAPYVVGLLTDNQPTRAEWQKVFYIAAGVYVIGWFVYLLFGSGREQPWNTPYEDRLVPVNIAREPRRPVMADILSINNADNDYIDSSPSGAEC